MPPSGTSAGSFASRRRRASCRRYPRPWPGRRRACISSGSSIWRRRPAACRPYNARELVEAGGLISYGPNFPALYARAAEFVDLILRGTKPAEIPVEQPTKFDLVINMTTAKALGLDVPPTLLARADEVIE
jgi:ABC transporter substrate binding protein